MSTTELIGTKQTLDEALLDNKPLSNWEKFVETCLKVEGEPEELVEIMLLSVIRALGDAIALLKAQEKHYTGNE